MQPKNNRFIRKSFYLRLAIAQQNWIFYHLDNDNQIRGGRAELSSALPPLSQINYHYHHGFSRPLEVLTKYIKF